MTNSEERKPDSDLITVYVTFQAEIKLCSATIVVRRQQLVFSSYTDKRVMCPLESPHAGTNPQKHYIYVYRSLAGIWVIVGLVWLALLLHMGGRLLQQAFWPVLPAGDQEGFPAKQEEGPEAVQCGV